MTLEINATLTATQTIVDLIEQLSPLETASTDQVDTGIWITMDPEWTEQIGYVGQLLAEQN